MIEPGSLLLATELDRRRQAEDPVLEHHFSSEGARLLVRGVAAGREMFLRAGERAGKSHVGAMLGVAMARGLRSVDGRTIDEVRAGVAPFPIEIPRAPIPLGILIVPSYKQAEDSIIKAYRTYIGSHPSHFVANSEGTSEIWIRQDGSRSNRYKDWFKITVYPKGGVLPRGFEASFAQADEPPDWTIWQQIRGRRGYHPIRRWITATPLDRNEWEEMRADYAIDEPWKEEIVITLFDNQSLPDDVKVEMAEVRANDPLARAKIYGEYVDLSGSSPFKHQHHILKAIEAECVNPPWEEQVRIRAVDVNELDATDAMGTVYVWRRPVPGEKYYIPIDLSLGVNDGNHDPCGFHVYSEGLVSPKGLVVRYNGFLGAYGTCWLAATQAEIYHDALCDPDMTGGYGGPGLTAFSNYRSELHPQGYRHIAHNPNPLTGEWKQPYGFVMDDVMKAEMIECIRWLVIHRAAEIPSLATVRCLIEAVMDDKQRLIKPKGVHYEDLICLGRFAFRHFALQRKEEAPILTRRSEETRIHAPTRTRPASQVTIGGGSFPWRRA